MPPLILIALLFVLPYLSSASHDREIYVLIRLKTSIVPNPSAAAPLAGWDLSAISPHHCAFASVTCDAATGRVIAINLAFLPLHAGSLPAKLALFDDLANLTITSCSLPGCIPAALTSLPSLRYLNLSNNKLSGLFPLPFASSYFPSLELLDCYNNSISGPLPPFGAAHADTLRYLQLGANYFSVMIPITYGDASTLQYLGLNGNTLSGGLPSKIWALRSLVCLEVAGCKLGRNGWAKTLDMTTDDCKCTDRL